MSNLNTQWSNLLVEELIRCGCTNFFISPGSRSAPLAAAVALHAKAESIVCHDERSTAFAALGFARATRMPGVIIVTSGTAVANLFPAIVEASIDRVPMIILSADLPSVMRDVGATQAIDQTKIYGSYVRWQHSLAPHDTPSVTSLLSTVDYLVHQSLHPISGPVQLNCMFDDPLAPIAQPFDFNPPEHWQSSSYPFTTYTVGVQQIDQQQLETIVKCVQRAERGLVVLAAQNRFERNYDIDALLNKLQWPVFADVNSGYRLSTENIVPHLDKIPEHYDVVLQLGGRIISKSMNTLLTNNKCKRHILVDEHPQRIDPSCLITDRIVSSIPIFCRQLSDRINACSNASRLHKINKVSATIEDIVSKAIDNDTKSIEIHVARKISLLVKEYSGLFLSNSMSMRDMDTFAVGGNETVSIASNRGTNGSDGIMSSACGFALGLKKPTTLLMGDMAFLHDVNGLSLLRDISVPLTIVVVNNGGGGIFSFLPIAKFPHILTPYTDGAHDFKIAPLCAAFGVKHEIVETKSAFNMAYVNALNSHKHRVIEVISNKTANVALHSSIDEAIARLFI